MILKFLSTVPELSAILLRVSLNLSVPASSRVKAANPAVLLLHKFLNAVVSPSTLSERIAITSPRLDPLPMSSAKLFPVCSSRIPATLEPLFASSSSIAPRLVVEIAVFIPPFVRSA